MMVGEEVGWFEGKESLRGRRTTDNYICMLKVIMIEQTHQFNEKISKYINNNYYYNLIEIILV